MATTDQTTKTVEKNFGVEKEILQLLMEIGYLGTQNLMPDMAERIFIGISGVRPKSEIPYIGLALSAMAKSNYHLAGYILGKKALPLNPKSSHVKNFLSIAMARTGYKAQAMELLEEVLKEAKEPNEITLAKDLLNDLKKT